MKRTKAQTPLKSTSGFTIIELMIAMTVLSVLLVLSTLTLIHLGRIYTKGNNQASVQDTTRNITSELASDIKLGADVPIPASVNSSSGSFCIGTTRYNYVIGQQVSSGHHALWRDSTSGGCAVLNMSVPSPSADGTELIPDHMRLSKLRITPINNGFSVDVGVAYGDDDLLCDTKQPSHCNSTWIAANTASHISALKSPTAEIGCVGDIGQEFCSVSQLNIEVGRRL